MVHSTITLTKAAAGTNNTTTKNAKQIAAAAVAADTDHLTFCLLIAPFYGGEGAQLTRV